MRLRSTPESTPRLYQKPTLHIPSSVSLFPFGFTAEPPRGLQHSNSQPQLLDNYHQPEERARTCVCVWKAGQSDRQTDRPDRPHRSRQKSTAIILHPAPDLRPANTACTCRRSCSARYRYLLRSTPLTTTLPRSPPLPPNTNTLLLLAGRLRPLHL